MKNNLNKQISKVDNNAKNLKELIEKASEDKEQLSTRFQMVIKISFEIRSFLHSTSKKKWKVENCISYKHSKHRA